MVSLDAYRRNIRTEKRQAILEASLHIFLTQGFQNAGMAAIAKQADVSTATLYKHFSSKDQLFGEMVEMHVNGYQVLPIDVDTLDTSDLRAALSKVSEGFVNLISDPRTVSIFRTIIGEADRFPILQKLIYEKGAQSLPQPFGTIFQQRQRCSPVDDHGPRHRRRMVYRFVKLLADFCARVQPRDDVQPTARHRDCYRKRGNVSGTLSGAIVLIPIDQKIRQIIVVNIIFA